MSELAIDSTDASDLERLNQLLDRIPVEHRAELESAMAQLIVRSERRGRILKLMQEALSQLRLDTKYLLFDLEATRRERDAWASRNEGESEW